MSECRMRIMIVHARGDEGKAGERGCGDGWAVVVACNERIETVGGGSGEETHGGAED